MFSARARISSSEKRWQVWQELLMFRSGRADVMIRDLERSHSRVRHVTVGAGDARAGVHALVPHLELGMLRLERLRPGFGVGPVGEAHFFVVVVDVLDLESLVPWIGQALLGSLEVVLDVTLAADERPHLLPGRHGVDVVVRNALRGLEGFDAFEEARSGDAELHGL